MGPPGGRNLRNDPEVCPGERLTQLDIWKLKFAVQEEGEGPTFWGLEGEVPTAPPGYRWGRGSEGGQHVLREAADFDRFYRRVTFGAFKRSRSAAFGTV